MSVNVGARVRLVAGANDVVDKRFVPGMTGVVSSTFDDGANVTLDEWPDEETEGASTLYGQMILAYFGEGTGAPTVPFTEDEFEVIA